MFLNRGTHLIYTLAEVRQTVQNYIAGQPGVYGIGPTTVIEGSSLIAETHEQATSVILSGDNL